MDHPFQDTGLVDAWIKLQYTAGDSPEHEALFWAYEQVDELVSATPQAIVSFALAVIARDSSVRVLANLSAGPLEDALSRHPYDIIEHFERAAKTHPLFAATLCGNWRSGCPQDVWDRVKAARNCDLWDSLDHAAYADDDDKA